jgi:hypothetical protein
MMFTSLKRLREPSPQSALDLSFSVNVQNALLKMRTTGKSATHKALYNALTIHKKDANNTRYLSP